MPFYIGENKIVDRYIGDKLVIAAYKGESKYFDAYSEITGSFPIVFKSRATVALKNYRIYGTSAGAGVETENLFDFADAVPRKYIDANGDEQSSAATDDYTATSHSGYMAVTPNEKYTFKANLNRITILDHYITFCWFDSSKKFISRDVNHNTQKYITTYQYTGTAPANATFCIMNFMGYHNKSKFMFVSGSTPPFSYIPHGYKLPLTVTGENAQSETYPLYIGDSKLGAEEYLDYAEQKVYKRTENLFDYTARDAGNGFVEDVYLFSNGLANSSSNYNISEYIEVLPNTTYAIAPCVGNTPGVCEYDSGKTYITGIAYHNEETITFTTTATTKYIRFSVRNTMDMEIMLVEGSTAPSSYIPYLKPTDPPVSLPTILTYQGENTLSSTETLGEATIKGRINELPNTP